MHPYRITNKQAKLPWLSKLSMKWMTSLTWIMRSGWWFNLLLRCEQFRWCCMSFQPQQSKTFMLFREHQQTRRNLTLPHSTEEISLEREELLNNLWQLYTLETTVPIGIILGWRVWGYWGRWGKYICAMANNPPCLQQRSINELHCGTCTGENHVTVLPSSFAGWWWGEGGERCTWPVPGYYWHLCN